MIIMILASEAMMSLEFQFFQHCMSYMTKGNNHDRMVKSK